MYLRYQFLALTSHELPCKYMGVCPLKACGTDSMQKLPLLKMHVAYCRLALGSVGDAHRIMK